MTTQTPAPQAGVRPAKYRYAAVGALASALLAFLIIAPVANWSRATALALESLALVVTIATSRARAGLRRARSAAAGLAATLVVVGTGTGLLPVAVTFAIGGLLAVAIPLALVGGLVRLVRTEGVTIQAVAGALAIYLLAGLAFAWLIAFVAHVEGNPYFAQVAHGTDGQVVYYSFAVLTTTGFGDLTAATPVGRALAVAEMLLGQLYLVTVIGVMVGNFSQRAGRAPAAPRCLSGDRYER